MIGADILLKSLLEEGVEVIFGYPGGVTIPFHDRLPNYKIKHILPRNEQGAAMAADAYFRVTGKPGVCLSTSGPGATNLVTGIANAYLDSVGIVAITCQVNSQVYGTDAFQEINMTSVTKDITKKNYFVKNVEDLPGIVKEAFYLAKNGRPRPVHIDIPVDVLRAKVDKFCYPKKINLEKSATLQEAPSKDIEKAIELIRKSKKPIAIVGHGVILSGATQELKEFVEFWKIPFVTTLLGIGALPDRHPLNFRMVGMHGMAYANMAVHDADLIIAIGTRFSDRITGSLDHYAKNSKVIHIEIDPREIGKNVKVDAGLLGDCKKILEQLNDKNFSSKKESQKRNVFHKKWIGKIRKWHKESCLAEIKSEAETRRKKYLMPYDILEEIGRVAKKDAIIISDVGQNQMWTAHYIDYSYPGQFLSSGGLGCMGYSLPAAIGAKIGKPQKDVWAVMGDGGFQMNMQELGTIMEQKLPIKIIILNNGYLGMVRQWQELFFNKNYVATKLDNPDFSKIARVYGIESHRISDLKKAKVAIKKTAQSKKAVFLEFLIEPENNVYPMMPPGSSLKDTMIKEC